MRVLLNTLLVEPYVSPRAHAVMAPIEQRFGSSRKIREGASVRYAYTRRCAHIERQCIEELEHIGAPPAGAERRLE